MRHNISLTCIRYRLRPVALDDSAFIVRLRSDPTRNHFVHEISGCLEDQIAWMEKYWQRPGDYYFIVENVRSGEPQGTIGIYDVGENNVGAVWGRWILKQGSLAALESAWLIYETAFAELGLQSLSSQTLVENNPVVSFHDSFGASRVALLERHFLIRGSRKSAIEHRVTVAEWPALRLRHHSTIARFANRER